MRIHPRNVDLTGLIDMHIHSAPDVRPRLLDDLEVAQQAAAAGMRAVVLKSHVTCTADRAAIAKKVTPDVHVFGSVTLNDAIGGLNRNRRFNDPGDFCEAAFNTFCPIYE